MKEDVDYWTYSVGFEPAPVACVYFQECRLGSLAASKGSSAASKGSLAASTAPWQPLKAPWQPLRSLQLTPGPSLPSQQPCTSQNRLSFRLTNYGPARLLWYYQERLDPTSEGQRLPAHGGTRSFSFAESRSRSHCTCTNQLSGSGSMQTKTVPKKGKKQ